MPSHTARPGRHRFGDATRPGLVHCTKFVAVATALAEHRRGWWTALLTPARHSLAGLRRASIGAELRWAPATATAA